MANIRDMIINDGGGRSMTSSPYANGRPFTFNTPSWPDSNQGVVVRPPGYDYGGYGYDGPSQAALDAAAAAQKAREDAQAEIDRQRNEQAAKEAAAKKAGKAQTKKENKNTQDIIDSLLDTLPGYKKGRDQQLRNATDTFRFGLKGLRSQYKQTLNDLEKAQDLNEADETAKTYANRANRAREQQSILAQIQAQGAGETDALRAQMQAFENADANQLDVTTAYYDTRNNINSALRQTNAETENARRNLWGQRQDANAQANGSYWDNYSRIWTEAQRAGASNTNIDSDYSTAFEADFGGKDPVEEASRLAGRVYDWNAPKPEWAGSWAERENSVGQRVTTPTKFATSAKLGPLKRAEGADLRKVDR